MWTISTARGEWKNFEGHKAIRLPEPVNSFRPGLLEVGDPPRGGKLKGPRVEGSEQLHRDLVIKPKAQGLV